MRSTIVIEKTATGYSAFVPDLLGCVATGANQREVEAEMKSAIRFHIDGMNQDGLPVPKPTRASGKQMTSFAKRKMRPIKS